MGQPQPPWDPEGQHGQQSYPGSQYGPSGPQPPPDPRQPPPGWYLDPGGQQVLRWWDGMQWGPHTQPLPGTGQASQRPDPDAGGDTASSSPGSAAGPPSASVPAAQPEPPEPVQPQGWPQQPYGQGPQPATPWPQHGQGPRKPWTARQKTGAGIVGAGVGLVILIIILGVTGGNSSGSGAAVAPSAASSSDPSASALAAPPGAAAGSPSSAPCTTHACIVSDLEQSLTGLVAEDEAVATKVTCYKSTVVFHQAADTYSASCTVIYSDGSQASGTGNLVVSSDQVTFQPAGT